MGRKERLRKQKARKAKQKPVNKSRRNFLKYIAGTAILAAAGTALYTLNSSDNEWAFLERTKEDMYMPPEYKSSIRNKYIPFGNKTTQSFYNVGDENAIRNAIHALNTELKKLNLPTTDKAPYTITLYTSNFGVESEKRFSDSAIEYCKRAIDFLHKKIPETADKNFEFVALKKGDNYRKDYQGKAFIADRYFQIQQIKAVNRNHPEQFGSISRTYSSNGAFCLITPDKKTNEIKENYAFIPAYNLALLSVFSETVPLATYQASNEHFNKDDHLAHVADESISEGLSRVLAEEFVDKINVPNGRQHLDNILLQSYKPKLYSNVPSAIEWVRKNGVKKAFDIYMENPRKFLKLIKS